MPTKLFVGNLSSDTSGDELKTLFSAVGEVDSCRLIIDRDSGRSKGFAFIEMNSEANANTAKETLNGQIVHGKPLKINDAKTRNQ